MYFQWKMAGDQNPKLAISRRRAKTALWQDAKVEGCLEHLHQICNHAVNARWAVAFLSIGCVLARLQAPEDMRPRQSPAIITKILTPHRHIISVKAPNRQTGCPPHINAL